MKPKEYVQRARSRCCQAVVLRSRVGEGYRQNVEYVQEKYELNVELKGLLMGRLSSLTLIKSVRLVAFDHGLGRLVSGIEHRVVPGRLCLCPHGELERVSASCPVWDICVPDLGRTDRHIRETHGLAHDGSFHSSA